jgi:site-specific DNA-methyltransferase (adenine-specific)
MERYTFHYQDMKDENGGKQMKNVWKLMPPSSQEKQLGKHPTQKPVSLVARCLRASTNIGDLIVDPFVGSGTTGVAALQLGRNFQGCEREEQYIHLAAKRLSRSDFSG